MAITTSASKLWRATGIRAEHQLEITVDGEPIKVFPLSPRRAAAAGRRKRRADGKLELRVPVAGGPSRGRRGVLQEARRAGRAGARAVPESALRRWDGGWRRCRRSRASRSSGPHDPTGPGRHAEPPPHFRLPAGDVSGGIVVRQNDRHRARQTCLSRHRPRGRTSTRCSRSSMTAAQQDGSFDAGIESALRRLLVEPAFPVPRRGRPRRAHGVRRGTAGGDRDRSIASATSSWRPVCRSSSGAAFPTTSC